MTQSAQEFLHVCVLTYNRENSLRRTLDAIAASPLKDYPVTVMDNCSTDGTPAICEELRARLPRLQVFRHLRNVGAGGNYMRALEFSGAEYKWVLCDDDTLFPERIAGLLDFLREHRPAACFVGGPRQEKWPAGPKLSPREIQRKYRTFFTAQSFIPALIFKDSLVGSRELLNGYYSANTNYPQFVIARKLYMEDIPCAVYQPHAVQRDEPAEKLAHHLDIVAGWATICRTLPKELRNQAFLSMFSGEGVPGMLKSVSRLILWGRIEGQSDIGYQLSRISINTGLRVRIPLMLCRPVSFIPGGVFNLMRETYRKVKYGMMRRPLPATFHTPVTQDELRR